MQINVLEYFERGALRTQPQKTAVIDRGRSYSFEEVARCGKNCAALNQQLGGKTILLAQQPEQQMLGSDMPVIQAFGFFCSIG